jgi:ribosomal protein S18 acetylase RimI-like enzyme
VGEITVREARPGDGAGIVRCHRDSARYYVELAPDLFREPDEDGQIEFAEPKGDGADDSLELVAELDGEIAGHLEARLEPPLDSARYQILSDVGEPRLFINALATAEQFKRRGVATALVEAAEEWGRARDATVAFLDTWVGSPSSIPFWEQRMGYERRAIIFRKRLS